MSDLEKKLDDDIEASIRAIKDGYRGEPEKLKNWVELITTILEQFKWQYVRARKSAARGEEIVGILRDRFVNSQRQLDAVKAYYALPWWQRITKKNPLRTKGE